METGNWESDSRVEQGTFLEGHVSAGRLRQLGQLALWESDARLKAPAAIEPLIEPSDVELL